MKTWGKITNRERGVCKESEVGISLASPKSNKEAMWLD